MKSSKKQLTFKEKTWIFFDQPKGFFPRLVQAIIVILILATVGSFFLEFSSAKIFLENEQFFYNLEVVAVIIFSIEYILRIWSSTDRFRFFINFYSIIDLLAILPFFLIESNFAGVRSLRVLRLLRASRLLRVAKILRPLLDTSQEKKLSVARVVQENVFKNVFVVVLLVYINQPMRDFILSVDSGLYPDITFAASIVVLAAMFGFFALSYGDVDNKRVTNRVLMHITTAMLMFPIGLMFIMLQHMLTVQIGSFPRLLVSAMWSVYVAVTLWDFVNVKRAEADIRKK